LTKEHPHPERSVFVSHRLVCIFGEIDNCEPVVGKPDPAVDIGALPVRPEVGESALTSCLKNPEHGVARKKR